MNINTKLTVFILSTSILIFTLSIGYVSYKNHHLALQDAKNLATQVAVDNALQIEKSLSENLHVLKTLAASFSVYDELPEEEWKELFIKMYYKVYAQNPDLYKLWDSWELHFFDTTWNKNYGRYAVTVFNQNNTIKHSTSLRSMDGDKGMYAEIKSIAKDMLWEPYWDEFLEDGEEKKFMTSISSPIRVNNQYVGIVAADIIMNRFQQIIEGIKPFKNSEAFLVSNQGIFVGHNQAELIGKTMEDYAPEFITEFNISEKIMKGSLATFEGNNENQGDFLLTIAPIQVGELETPWSLGLIIPKSAILAQANNTMYLTLLVSLGGLILLFFIIIYISKRITSSIKITTKILEKIAEGDIADTNKIVLNTGDEVEVMTQSVNKLLVVLNKTSAFANEIGQGNLDADFETLSEKDILGNALLDMRNSLKQAEEVDNKRKIEDEKRSWLTQGQAKFGEILRSNGQDIKELSYEVMSNLISYLNVNQGALFVIDDSDEAEISFNLASAIAYDRKKFLQKNIKLGEGLVGRCAFEKKTIYMTEIPQDYMEITSGLGTANPTSILLVPLILNDEIFGVIELASFNLFEKHHIEFVEKLGESISSTIATVKINERTSNLLAESKNQSEELSAQEEEMRQNLEELQATQEEASRREFEMEGIIKALGNTAFTVEYDMDGNVLTANEKYAELLQVSTDKIVGTNHAEGFTFNQEQQEKYQRFWQDLKQGVIKHEVNQLDVNGKKRWVNETYTPIFEKNTNAPYKILKIGFDISDQKQREMLVKDQEIRIKKEAMVIGEYRSRIKELESQIEEVKSQTPEPVIIEKIIEKKPAIQPEPQQDENNNIEGKLDHEDALIWRSDYALGIEELDEQHKQLINLSTVLIDAISDNKNKKEIKEHLRSLIDFASYHFGNEEAYFEVFNYTQKEEHIEEHKQFIKDLSRLQKEYTSGKLKDLSNKTLGIKQWLRNHLLEKDQAYKDHFKSNGL